ncbi:hypothetical protein [Pedobacter antarcticus]|uniref:hypothetical protein n=1 Tax=Pedobacter antarcticus TaxID=34086 RepID=UPI00292E8129|nr:hypothetical protein [Pedobacter antarcticus]
MIIKKLALVFLLLINAVTGIQGQTVNLQSGVLISKAENTRLSNIQISNKRSSAVVKSDLLGLYQILAEVGDTLEISDSLYETQKIVVSNFTFIKTTLRPWLLLNEVVIRANSFKADLDEVQGQFKSQGVFYTGTPHYYYLLLKPMTFIYENFKKEVKNARKFRKYAEHELAHNKITQRFNNLSIKAVVPINDQDLSSFKLQYMPSPEQISAWNDYDLNRYIIKSYAQFKAQTKN